MAADMVSGRASELACRIIPCLDVQAGRTVKGRRFVDLRDAGDPVDLAARYCDEGADELVLLDIGASREGRSTFLDLVRDVATAITIPFTVGGGIASVDDVVRALDAGADKVSLNSAIIRDPGLIAAAASRVGSQAIVAAIDVRRRGEARWGIWSRGGTEPTGLDALGWSRRVVECGAGEMLLTSMDRDGTRGGYDLDLLRHICTSIPVPVIASGGAGTIGHIIDAVRIGRADAVLAAGILHYGDVTIGRIKRQMRSHDIPVRL